MVKAIEEKTEKLKEKQVQETKKQQEEDDQQEDQDYDRPKPKMKTAKELEQLAKLEDDKTKFNTDKKLNDQLTLQNLSYQNDITSDQIKMIDLKLTNNIYLIL